MLVECCDFVIDYCVVGVFLKFSFERLLPREHIDDRVAFVNGCGTEQSPELAFSVLEVR